MLKTNCKAVNEKIKKMIIDSYDKEYFSFDGRTPSTDYNGICKDIIEALHNEKGLDCQYRAGRISEQTLFTDWLQGLPTATSLGDDIFLRDAAALVADLLEQTDAEKAKYTEQESEKLAAYLFYREIKKHAK